MYRHVLRNALIPIVTVIGLAGRLSAGRLRGGGAAVRLAGHRRPAADRASGLRDYTLVQGITVLFVIGFLLINLLVEVLYRLINPRLR